MRDEKLDRGGGGRADLPTSADVAQANDDLGSRRARAGLPTSADVAEAMTKLGVDRGALDGYRPDLAPSAGAAISAALSYLGSRVGRRRR